MSYFYSRKKGEKGELFGFTVTAAVLIRPAARSRFELVK
jgi:hypothetical protein